MKEDANDWIKKASEFVLQSNYNEAIKCYDKAIRLDPNDVDAWNDKGLALVALGISNEAIECFEKARKIKSQN
jgi:tetratricopeptide (TPR) repeat protein